MHFVRIFQDRYFLCFQTLKRFFAYCSFPSPHDVDKARKLPSLPTNHHRRGMLPRTPLGDRIEPTTALQIAMSLYTHSPTLTLLLQLISTTLMSSISSFPPFTARPGVIYFHFLHNYLFFSNFYQGVYGSKSLL